MIEKEISYSTTVLMGTIIACSLMICHTIMLAAGKCGLIYGYTAVAAAFVLVGYIIARVER